MNGYDLTGSRFGILTALRRGPLLNNGTHGTWWCRCDCGAVKLVRSQSLRRGCTKSCGHKKHRRGPQHDGLIERLDAQDRDLGDLCSWSVNAGGYAVGRTSSSPTYLHRLVGARIAGRPLSTADVVDHINGDKLDNRRSNLRVVDMATNTQNRIKPHPKNTSGYRGVIWCKIMGAWRAEAIVRYKSTILGYFPSAAAAGAAVKEWRLKHMPGATS